MQMFNLNTLVVVVPAIIVALTFHEYAHAKTATLLGDPTPRNQGRLTLNPLKHLDILGTIMFFIARFGWAKPVQVNPFYFKGDRRKGMMLVGIAGPAMNLALAYLAAVTLRLIEVFPNYWLYQFISSVVIYNTILAVFNLLPIPPLDGSKVLAWLLPRGQAVWLDHMETYGPIILIMLILLGVINMIIWPVVDLVLEGIMVLSGISNL